MVQKTRGLQGLAARNVRGGRRRLSTMKILRGLEIAAWSAGLLMLGTYSGLRWWSANARDEALASFEVARDAAAGARSVDAFASASAELDDVDTSTWAPQRTELYRRSLGTDRVPQAVLRIPSVRLTVPVFDGASEANLNRGAGRIEGAGRIGEHGNIGIAAHRDGFFRSLKDVRVGDLILLDRFESTDRYRIIATYVVEPTDVGVLAPTTARSLTLVTCYPFYFVGSAPQRFIVRAQLDSADKEDAPAGEHSMNAGRRE